MRSYPILATAAVAALLAGCSSGSGGGDSTPPSTSSSTAAATTTTTLQTHTAEPGATGVSPNGVTTAVGEPAQSTEDEYFQACHAAKVWMQQRGGDQKAQFEPYLESLQKSDSAGPGTFGTPWSKLPAARQSAVIVAADAAADDLCG
ncbi:lipoprotein LpqV [Mycobacterium yunnanensis]|uniref:Lipoprotein LpqV n=1 Tax=Mycobacterium yunnanensis TaxID=368477 RepID=A0A9X3C3T8_9MYCO|nr:lipoprotein LpqV [Mycobacterium yunnanensis]MCV7422692.1 lipoprotein LpqV [Mycobacterium yunnanensis]